MKTALRIVVLLVIVFAAAGCFSITTRCGWRSADPIPSVAGGCAEQIRRAGGYRMHYFEALPAKGRQGRRWCWCMGWARGARTGRR